MNPVPLLAKWSSICVWIKRKLLTPTGYLLLIHQHCSAGKGETKAEFIHRQELQSPNIKEIAWNFKKQLWPKCSNILYFQKSWEKDELSKKNKFHFNFCLNASKQKKKKKSRVCLFSHCCQLGWSPLYSHLFPPCGEGLPSKQVRAETNQYDRGLALQQKRSWMFISKHLKFTTPPHGSKNKQNKNWL